MRERLIRALSGTPAVVAGLTAGLAPDDERWDRRPYADRFTLREVAAHLADWDRIYVERLTLMRDRPGSPLIAYDESHLAIVHGYAHSAPRLSIRRLAESRSAMVRLLQDLTEPQWANTGVHPDQGPLSIDLHASYILMHDGYHTQQVAEWMRLPE
jgi:uncharacterized damage-inducible protein DinB